MQIPAVAFQAPREARKRGYDCSTNPARAAWFAHELNNKTHRRARAQRNAGPQLIGR
jgi:hypothetical protein